MAGHQGPRLLEQDVEGLGLDLARDLEDVAKALRGQQAARGGLALDDGVGGDRRAVHQVVHVTGARPAPASGLLT